MTNPRLELGLLDYQAEAFHCGARNIVFVKGRRAGGTEALCRNQLALSIMNPNTKALWIDTINRNITRYIKRYFKPKLQHLRDWSGNPLWGFNGAEMTMTFWNGSVIDFGSAERSENLEGFAYDYINLNEAGHILWDEDLYYQTLAPMGVEGKGAQWFMNGAPKGKNLFHEFWERGQSDDPEWSSSRATSYDNPLVNRDLIDRMKKHYPEAIFRQEFLAEFIDDGAYFQGIKEAAIAQEQTQAPPVEPYVIGLDLAMTEDYTVAWVGRVGTHEGIYCERYSRLKWEDQLYRLADLSKRYNNARVLVDATSLGGLIALEDIQKAGVPATGFTFTASSKIQLMSALAVDIEQKRITFYPHEETVKELRAFQSTRTSSGHVKLEAPKQMHDDCVVALALMNKAWGRSAAGDMKIVSTPGIGSEMEAIT